MSKVACGRVASMVGSIDCVYGLDLGWGWGWGFCWDWVPPGKSAGAQGNWALF